MHGEEVNQIKLAVSYAALQAMLSGEELVVQIDDETEVWLRVDDAAKEKIFRDQVNTFILMNAPISPVAH